MERTVVFYLDDDQEDIEIFTEILASQSRLLLTYTTQDALLAGLHENFCASAILFLDVLIPGTSGVEVLETIRSERTFAGIPVIMLTASYDDAFVKSAFDMGANYYMRKSASYSTLQANLGGIIRIDWTLFQPSFRDFVIS